MPRTPSEGLEHAKKTADKYISPSGGPPPRGRDCRGFELAKHKEKIRNQKEEIAKLKRSIQDWKIYVDRLEMTNKYLTPSAETKLEDES